MHEWRWGLGVAILIVITLALVVSMLTARNRSFVDTKRHLRQRRFRPDWGRTRSDSSSRRRGIHIRR